jgi:hypothetical protein
MARGKTSPLLPGEYEAAPETPAPQESRIAQDIFEVYCKDPDPQAFWEAMKRQNPKEFARILLEHAAPILARVHRATGSAPQAHLRTLPTAISPIRPGIIDVDVKK